MKKIFLTKGYSVLVDDIDYDWLNQWSWFYDSSGYAARWRKKGENKSTRFITMHREIASSFLCVGKFLVDHKNRNTLDNRRQNLRLATRSQNSANQKRKLTCKGVRFRHRKWQARIRVNGKEIYLGSFEEKDEAIKAYNDAAEKYFGKFACLNQG